jgi:hypothetical protein
MLLASSQDATLLVSAMARPTGVGAFPGQAYAQIIDRHRGASLGRF